MALVVIVAVALLLIICVVGTAVAVFAPQPQPTPTPEPSPAGGLTPGSGVSGTPVAPTAPPVFQTPTLTPSPTPEPDPQGDAELYEGGALVAQPPAGADIRGASVAPDLHVSLQPPAAGVPAELTGWAGQDEVLLWIELHQPIPNPPGWYTEWLFALDLDGDETTGRPTGEARINPDLGMEVAVGVYYEPARGEYATYLLVWDPNQGQLVSLSAAPTFRYTIAPSRTLIGLAMPMATLEQAAAQAGTSLVTDAAQGRAAALVTTAQQRAIDYYPERYAGVE